MSEFFALQADRHSEVEDFRRNVLEGKYPLTTDEAHALIVSFAARTFTTAWFKEWGVPIVGHTARIVRDFDGQPYDSFDHRLRVQVNPPGSVKTVRYAYPPTGDEYTRYVTQNGTMVPVITGLPHEQHGEVVYPTWLWPGSVVDDLYKLSEELANTFDWPVLSGDWSGRVRNTAAVRFVLTGDAPAVRPLYGGWGFTRVELFNSPYPQWRVQLTAAPWVPPEEVSHAHRFFRDQLHEGRALPKTTRPLEVASFVWRQTRLNSYPQPRPWRALWEQWNAESPEDDQFEDYRHFRTYFLRGEAAVKKLNFDRPFHYKM